MAVEEERKGYRSPPPHTTQRRHVPLSQSDYSISAAATNPRKTALGRIV